MQLKTERLIIRHIIENDWKDIQEIWKDEMQSSYGMFDMVKSTEDEAVREHICAWDKANRNHGCGHMYFAICLKKKVIGYVSFNVRKNGYEVGYCVHSHYQRNGYAKESLLALFRYLQGKGITTFLAGTALENHPSVKLLISTGFKQVGTERVSFRVNEDGENFFFDGGVFELKCTTQQ